MHVKGYFGSDVSRLRIAIMFLCPDLQNGELLSSSMSIRGNRGVNTSCIYAFLLLARALKIHRDTFSLSVRFSLVHEVRTPAVSELSTEKEEERGQ